VSIDFEISRLVSEPVSWVEDLRTQLAIRKKISETHTGIQAMNPIGDDSTCLLAQGKMEIVMPFLQTQMQHLATFFMDSYKGGQTSFCHFPTTTL
jgi:hypothetical protein